MRDAIMASLPSLPKCRPAWKVDSNRIILSVLGREIGLSYDRNDKRLSIHLEHPLAEMWQRLLVPRWDRQNRGKCKTCRGTGWDGIGYSLTCVDCGGTGLPPVTALALDKFGKQRAQL